MQAVKYLLTTYDKPSEGQYYYNCSFNIIPFFPPNPKNKLYKVTINEALFRNDEPTLISGDYMEFTITYANGDTTVYRMSLISNFYTQTNGTIDYTAIKTLLTSTDTSIWNFTTTDSGTDNTITAFAITIPETITADAVPTTGYNITASYTTADANTSTISDVTLSYSSNFAYLFDNMNMTIDRSTSSATSSSFQFWTMRLGGPYIYQIQTIPCQAMVTTCNAINQRFNVGAMTYNLNSSKGGLCHCISSMELQASDLSSFRIHLINDQGESVQIRNTIYIQITVTPSD